MHYRASRHSLLCIQVLSTGHPGTHYWTSRHSVLCIQVLSTGHPSTHYWTSRHSLLCIQVLSTGHPGIVDWNGIIYVLFRPDSIDLLFLSCFSDPFQRLARDKSKKIQQTKLLHENVKHFREISLFLINISFIFHGLSNTLFIIHQW